jgi:DNA-binding NtrC family response regulator
VVSIPAKPFRVLIVDDDAASRETAAAILEADFEVFTESSPLRAAERVATEQFHVACIDREMPGMNGEELLRLIRERSPTTGTLMITGAPHDASAALRSDPELVAILGKPFDPNRLVRLVEQLARLSEMRQTLARSARPPTRRPV